MYEEYKRARNFAWKILIKNKIVKFPLDINYLLDKYKISLLTFQEGEELFKRYGITPKGDGFPLLLGKEYFIFYKSYFPKKDRFTIMHEFGHIVLGHVSKDVVFEFGEYAENEANVVASRILMPAIVCYVECIHEPQQIKDFFDVSGQAADIRAKRIQELTVRNKWLTSPLEEKYYKIYKINKIK